MPSFDVVSEIDTHELNNAIDQANREITTRFDFKGSDAKFEFKEENINLSAQSDFQIKQMQLVLESKLTKRGISLKVLDYGNISTNLNEAKQVIKVKQGIDKDNAKKITKHIKESKVKVQASIQGEQVRVTGKKRDDLQDAIANLKEANLELPLQFNNFRD